MVPLEARRPCAPEGARLDFIDGARDRCRSDLLLHQWVNAGHAGSRRHGDQALIVNNAPGDDNIARRAGGVIIHAACRAGDVDHGDLSHHGNAGSGTLPQSLARLHRDPTGGLVSERQPPAVRSM